MATKKLYYAGRTGPLLYEDTGRYPDNGAFVEAARFPQLYFEIEATQYYHGVRKSMHDSAVTSLSTTASTNHSANLIAESIALSTASDAHGDASVADSKAVSVSTIASANLITSDSKAVSLSTLTSTADSKAVSAAGIASASAVDSVARSSILVTDATASTNHSSNLIAESTALSTATAESKAVSYATVADSKAVSLALVDTGKKPYHGTQSIGAVTFDNSSHVVTIATGVTYWVNGVQKVNTGSTTFDIDSFETPLVTNTLYFIYFDDVSGTLKGDKTFWNLKTQVPICTVLWNGSAGAIQQEWHNFTRDIDWHINAHLTIGARYYNGLDKTLPTAADDNHLQIESGIIYDEDLPITTGQQTTCRILYKASVSVYTFVDSSLPYAGSGVQPQYLKTDAPYALADVGANDFAVMWVYASTDTSRPIYIIPTHGTAAHNTLALARAEVIPNLAALNLNPELKLIYKFIYKGNGDFQESVDYRNTSSLPAGGSASTTASAVSFTPYSTIAATTVQTAIQEVLDEMPASSGHTIIDEDGDAMTTRAKLQFTGGAVVTDNGSDTTIVTISGGGFVLTEIDSFGNIVPVDYAETVAAGLWEVNIDGSLVPSNTGTVDELWELDGNRIMPKAA